MPISSCRINQLTLVVSGRREMDGRCMFVPVSFSPRERGRGGRGVEKWKISVFDPG